MYACDKTNKHINISSRHCYRKVGDGGGCEEPCEQTEAFVSFHSGSFDLSHFRELGGMS